MLVKEKKNWGIQIMTGKGRVVGNDVKQVSSGQVTG